MQFNYSIQQAGLGQMERQVIDSMAHAGSLVFRATDLEKKLGYNIKYAHLILSRLCKKGWVQRLKSGIYRIIPLGSDSINPTPDDAWALAMVLFSPCYIPGWTAAEHWELTEQIFNSTVLFTAEKQRKKDQLIAGLIYRIKSIPLKEFFGTHKIWSSNTPILIADIHRTVIDILDDPTIGGGGRQMLDIVKAYWEKKTADPERLWQYAEKLEHGAVMKRLGFISEKIIRLPSPWLERAHLKIKTGIINFDPNGPNLGPIITKWGIRINIPLGDIT